MKGLKYTAIALSALLLVMLGLVGYLFLTAEVQVVEVSAKGVSSASDLAGFEALRDSIQNDTFYGTLYQKPHEWKDASEYVLLTYKLRLRNNCLVPIDMIEVQVVPQSTDIAQLPSLTVKSLDMKSEGEYEVQILTARESHSVRELLVSFYLWGVSGNVKTVCGK